VSHGPPVEGRERDEEFERLIGTLLEPPSERGIRADAETHSRPPSKARGRGMRPGGAGRDSLYRRLLAIADVLAACATLILVAEVLGDDHLNAWALLAIPAVLMVSKAAGVYERDALLLRKGTLDEVPALLRVATFWTFVIWVLQDFFIEGYFWRDQLAALWFSLFIAMVAARALARRLARALALEERCLILGGPGTAGALDRKLGQASAVKARVVGRVPTDGIDFDGGAVPVLGGLGDLREIVERHAVDRAIIAPDESETDRLPELVRLAEDAGVKISLLPRLLEVVGSSVELDELNGTSLLAVRGYGLTRSSRAIKRGVDVLGATFGIIVLAPLLFAIAVAVKLTSRGPVIFRQCRMGCGGAVFEMLKFRTMVDGAEAGQAGLAALNEADGLFKIKDDPRVTRAGRFLRRTSLDELLQLVNVLRGDMSLVGPRPFVIDEDRGITGWQRRRLLVRPGMTGLWQIFGGPLIPLQEAVKIDYLYAARWSLWLDLKILLRTVPYVLAKRGI
jgi:exopolysaccharide biosynthesis polyprenyl glycosylphosphotransferase